jgi:hypothetical protein
MEIFLRNFAKSRNGNFELLPNINNSSRILPSTINSDEFKDNVQDFDTKSRKFSDKEIYPLIIQITKEEIITFSKLTLVLDFDGALFTVLDKSAIPLEKKDTPLTIDLIRSFKDNTKEDITFFIECKSFRNSPLLDKRASKELRCFIKNEQDVVIKQFPDDNAHIVPGDLVLVGDDAPAEAVYICDVEDNIPSIEDVRAELQKLNVPLIVVPIQANVGDTWLQDQFQFGFTSNNVAALPIIFHLPRMVNDSALVYSAPNLKHLVDKYFPSNRLGLFNDFWKLPIPVTDGKTSYEFKITQTFIIYKRLLIVIRLLKRLISLTIKFDGAVAKSYRRFDFSNIFSVRKEIEKLSELLSKNSKVKADDQKGIRKSIDMINSWLSFDKKTETVQLSIHIIDENKKEVTLNFNFSENNYTNLNNFFKLTLQIHSSLGYGGNIEVSPPWNDFKFGKIITGSLINKSLEDFIRANPQKQPACKVYTEWLEVGHIDELMGFVKDRNASSGFSIVRAAPHLARNLLKDIIQFKNENNYLVTRLFRGKKWTHELQPKGDIAHTPPNTFKKYIELAKSKYDLSGFDKKFSTDEKDDFWDSAYHDDRKFIVYNVQNKVKTKYAAFISCEDIFEITSVTNSRIENLFLKDADVYYDPEMYEGDYLSDHYRQQIDPYRLDKIIKSEYPQSNILYIPVLFDYALNFSLNQISAIVPDCANFQTINNHILMPRPYGPRMKVKESIEFIKSFFSRNNIPSGTLSSLNEQYIMEAGLDKVFHWTNGKMIRDSNEIKLSNDSYGTESVSAANPSKRLSEFDGEENYENFLIEASKDFYSEYPSGYVKKFPVTNHPVKIGENLRLIATYFKDGFDEFKNCPVNFCAGDTTESHPKLDAFEKNIRKIEEAIRKANTGVFDDQGKIIPESWVKIAIPENTVDIFELYIHLVLASTGVTIRWVDSWYYHTHSGGIHCGTNVIRKLPN